MSSLLRNLILALGLAVILWLGYSLFLSKEDDTAVTQNGEMVNEALVNSQEFLGSIQELKKLELKDDVFKDTRFTSLKLFYKATTSEPVGRENPFLPVGE